MGDQGTSGAPPEWFQRYILEQQTQAAAAREDECLQIAEQEQKAKEARLQLVRNDNKLEKSFSLLLEYYGESEKLEAWLQQARAKIEVDYYRYTEFVKFWALNRLLQNKALCRIEV
jgi:hypothetical protein